MSQEKLLVHSARADKTEEFFQCAVLVPAARFFPRIRAGSEYSAKLCAPLAVLTFSADGQGPKALANPPPPAPGCQCNQCDQLHVPLAAGVPFVRANRRYPS